MARPIGRPAFSFADALRRELADGSDSPKRLRTIARKLIECAESGESWAVQQIADRLDGKPAQAHHHAGSIGTYDLSKATDEQLAALESVLGSLADAGGSEGGEAETHH